MGCLRIRWFQSIVWIALNCGEIARGKGGKEGGDVKGEKRKAETNQKPAPTSEAGSWKITPFARSA